MTKRALISVSDKAGIVEFAQELKKLGWDIISTGGTKVALDNAGVDTIAIDDVTGFPEMMDGRVKTLHPNIHGGLLARRDLDSHLQAAKDNNIELIDLVVVNLYPFKETILKPDVTYADAVENIDIFNRISVSHVWFKNRFLEWVKVDHPCFVQQRRTMLA